MVKMKEFRIMLSEFLKAIKAYQKIPLSLNSIHYVKRGGAPWL